MESRLTIDDIHSLEQYSRIRQNFRSSVLAHQKLRRVQLGEHLVLCFEDRLTVQYQVQEILLASRIYERDFIEAELDAYAPLIPARGEAKATIMLHSPEALSNPKIGECVWLQFAGASRINASSDYNVSGCAAMQWLTFKFDDDSIAGIEKLANNKQQSLDIGVNCGRLEYQQTVSREVCELVVRDVLAVA